MKRVVILRRSAVQLKAYEGRFYSSELDVTYEVFGHDGALKVRYPGGDINLDPVGKDAAPIGSVKFMCTDDGKCNALSIGGGRAQNLRFVRAAVTTADAKPGG